MSYEYTLEGNTKQYYYEACMSSDRAGDYTIEKTSSPDSFKIHFKNAMIEPCWIPDYIPVAKIHDYLWRCYKIADKANETGRSNAFADLRNLIGVT